MRERTLRTVVSVLLGLVFTAGLVGEAYGFHSCPHHHPSPEAAGVAGDADAADGHGAQRDETSDPRPLRAPPDGPCTCVGNCHAASVALDAPPAPAVPSPLETDFALALPAPDGRTTRSAAYLLPFANGPPSPLA